mmetsp:Transcript_95628/g.243052  ORF Transcript_95628/g.243052 Transcript_95628/m.243052 type:complete len:235 (+) Transcript_95628:1470-2174(+)
MVSGSSDLSRSALEMQKASATFTRAWSSIVRCWLWCPSRRHSHFQSRSASHWPSRHVSMRQRRPVCPFMRQCLVAETILAPPCKDPPSSFSSPRCVRCASTRSSRQVCTHARTSRSWPRLDASHWCSSSCLRFSWRTPSDLRAPSWCRCTCPAWRSRSRLRCASRGTLARCPEAPSRCGARTELTPTRNPASPLQRHERDLHGASTGVPMQLRLRSTVCSQSCDCNWIVQMRAS